MKKMLLCITLLLLLSLKVCAMTFDEAFQESGRKPMLVLVYAKWADNYQTYLDTFKTIEKSLGSVYNYVELDITTADAKAYNKRYQIYPNLPYIMMFRNEVKISRFIQNNCAISPSCTISKAKSFIQ